jgi:hypothetical protein
MQCLAEAVVIKKDALPGYTLVQAQVDADGWPKGFYGLVESNDPVFVFAGPLIADPMAGMSDEEIDALPDMPAGYAAFMKAAEEMGTHLKLEALVGYRLVKTCMDELGYAPDTDGAFHFWLLNYLARTS